MKTILAPIDLSPVTPGVVAEAAQLARELKAHMVLLNVTRSGRLFEDEAAFRKAIADFEEHPLEKKLGACENETGSEAVSGDSLQLIGEPVSVILDQASKLSADYIIMGSHGHSALYDVVVGSVCAGVVKQANCPVIVVPARTTQLLAYLKRIGDRRPRVEFHRRCERMTHHRLVQGRASINALGHR